MGLHLNRAALLGHLSQVEPGLSSREILEQSSCICFRKGWLITFNGEVACRVNAGLDHSLLGAVQAGPLLAILQKMNEEEIELEPADGELIIVGKRRRAGIRMEKELLLPIASVEKPEEWKALPDDFTEGLSIIQEGASMDESKFVMTCVHFHAKHIEACDDYQAVRFTLKLTGLSKPTLIKKESAKHIASLDMTEFAETENFLHFRNPSKLILSCRRYSEGYVEDFPDVAKVLEMESGVTATLPKGIAEAADRAEVFSSENSDNNQVQVELRAGKVRVKGQGVSGWYQEVGNISYKGPALKFLIPPKLLVELVKRHSECELTEDRLRVLAGKMSYVTCLSKVEENGEVKE